jgi:hypothetical protein
LAITRVYLLRYFEDIRKSLLYVCGRKCRWGCSRYGGEERCIQGFMGKCKGKRPLGRIILRWIFRKWNGGMEWIDLAEGRDRWQALVNAVVKLRIP